MVVNRVRGLPDYGENMRQLREKPHISIYAAGLFICDRANTADFVGFGETHESALRKWAEFNNYRWNATGRYWYMP